MAKKQQLKLRQIVDDESTWVEYPFDVAMRCGVLKKNPRRDEYIYVEGEDAHIIIEARLEELGFTQRYTQYWVPNFKRWLKGKQWPEAMEWSGGEWPEGSVWRDYKKGK